MNIKRKSIFIEDTEDIINHISKYCISNEVQTLVHKILEKKRLGRHKGVDKLVNKVKVAHGKDLDGAVEMDIMDVLTDLAESACTVVTPKKRFK